MKIQEIFLMQQVYRTYIQGAQFKGNVSLKNKVVIVTGCNTGIGKETALDLAKRGARVYMGCRDTLKSEIAKSEIIEKSKNKNVYNFELDLSSFQSIRNFVRNFNRVEQHLHILINNAGCTCKTHILTADGFERTFAVNYLGHFLLTHLLLAILKKTGHSRIVNVSSYVHNWGKIHKEDINFIERPYNQVTAYTQSKLANILFTKYLAKQLAGSSVNVNAVHPGGVKTELTRNHPIHIKLFIFLCHLFMKNATSGAQTTLTVALDPDLKNVSGKYFSECKVIKESELAQDEELAEWLWMNSMKWIKV